MNSIIALVFCLLQVNLALGSSMLTEHFIDSINEKAETWTAGYNFPGYTRRQLKKLAGVKDGYEEHLPPVRPTPMTRRPIPASFDARQAWPECPAIGEIYDQGNCGSCYVVSSASVMTDRMCIHTNASVHISPLDGLSCCTSCGDCNDGGWPSAVFEYWNSTGIVTGGPYNSSDGCRPYSFAPAGTTLRSSFGSYIPTPVCNRTCEEGYPKNYTDDKYFGQDGVYSIASDVASIQTEIMTNGPVVAAFVVYQDFYAYVSGVYQHTMGYFMGGHAIRIIGWGVENGTDYWLVANSWNYGWGDRGTFKILRGVNHVGIESRVIAGLPL